MKKAKSKSASRELKPEKLGSLTIKPIGVVRSIYRDKFGIPRQPGLAKSIVTRLVFDSNPKIRHALNGMEGFSHLWVVFVFNETGSEEWLPTVRPPRLGGKARIGVLATRSPHRPNSLGLSAVRILGVHLPPKGAPMIEVEGGDFLDGTPIIDVKPYVAYADSFPEASMGWVEPLSWEPVKIEFSRESRERLEHHSARLDQPTLIQFVEEVLAQDPRPASQRRKYPVGEASALGKRFGVLLGDIDVRFELREDRFFVFDIVQDP